MDLHSKDFLGRVAIKDKSPAVMRAFLKGWLVVEMPWDLSQISENQPLPNTIMSPVDGAEMVLVPAGEFTLGIDQEELYHIFTRNNLGFLQKSSAHNRGTNYLLQ